MPPDRLILVVDGPQEDAVEELLARVVRRMVRDTYDKRALVDAVQEALLLLVLRHVQEPVLERGKL